MSDTFYSYTYCVAPKPFPQSFESQDAFEAYVEAERANVARQYDGLTNVMVGTRNGRGAYVLKKVAGMVDIPALGFLYRERQASFQYGANDVTGDDEGTGDECIVAHVQGVLALLVNARRHGLAALHLFMYV